MTAMLSAFLKDESAATAIEYALIAAGIAIAIIGAVGSAGDAIKAIFTTIKEKLLA